MYVLLITLLFSTFAIDKEAMAQSTLLEDVKRNPNEAKSICKDFMELNRNDISASSQQSLKKIAKQKNINEVDAEILSMYVRGLYCPETF